MDAPSAAATSSPAAFHPTVFLRVGSPPGKTAPGRHAATPSPKQTLPVPVYVDDDDASSSSSPPSPDAALPAFVFLRQAHGAAAYSLVTGGGFPRVWAGAGAGAGPGAGTGTGAGVLRTLSTVCPRRFLRPARVALAGELPLSAVSSLSSSSSTSSPASSRSSSPAALGTVSSAPSFALNRKGGRVRFSVPQLGGRGTFAWAAEPGAAHTLYYYTADARRTVVVVARLQRGRGWLAIDVEAGGVLGTGTHGPQQQQRREQLVAAVVTTALCVVVEML